MKIDVDSQTAFETLDARIRTLLPEEYRDSYEDVQPKSMGSAGLKCFGAAISSSIRRRPICSTSDGAKPIGASKAR